MLRRRKKDEPTRARDDDDNIVPLSDPANAWWAEREELDSSKVPTGRTKKKVVEEPKRSSFEDYFSTESLFDWSGDDGGVFDETDPYVVLDLPPTATWEEITVAHRRLAKKHHPDHLQNATEEEREASDKRIRDLNIAYMELRRRKGR